MRTPEPEPAPAAEPARPRRARVRWPKTLTFKERGGQMKARRLAGKVHDAFPDTPPRNVAARVRAVQRRRSKNKRAAKSRNKNR